MISHPFPGSSKYYNLGVSLIFILTYTHIFPFVDLSSVKVSILNMLKLKDIEMWDNTGLLEFRNFSTFQLGHSCCEFGETLYTTASTVIEVSVSIMSFLHFILTV